MYACLSFRTEENPCENLVKMSLNFFMVRKRRKRNTSPPEISRTQTMEMAHPAMENFSKKDSDVSPMVLKKRRKAGISQTKVMARITSTRTESMMRSVTTVPNAVGKEVRSVFFKVAQREISPMRGITRLAANDI